MGFKTLLNNIAIGATRAIGSGKLLMKAKSPEILVGTGIALGVATVVVACRETPKCYDILDQYEKDMAAVEEALVKAKNNPTVDYTPEQAQKDRMHFTSHCAWMIFKCYAPSIALGALSVVCTLKGFGILKSRLRDMTIAYTTLAGTFAAYRKRVIETEGEARDKYYYTGIKETTTKVPTTDENGNTVDVEVTETTGTLDPDVYKRLFTFEWSPLNSSEATYNAGNNSWTAYAPKAQKINKYIAWNEYITFNSILKEFFCIKKAPAYGNIFGARRTKENTVGETCNAVKIQTYIIPNRNDGAIMVEILGMEPLFNPTGDLEKELITNESIDTEITADNGGLLYYEDAKSGLDDPEAIRRWRKAMTTAEA